MFKTSLIEDEREGLKQKSIVLLETHVRVVYRVESTRNCFLFYVDRDMDDISAFFEFVDKLLPEYVIEIVYSSLELDDYILTFNELKAIKKDLTSIPNIPAGREHTPKIPYWNGKTEGCCYKFGMRCE